MNSSQTYSPFAADRSKKLINFGIAFGCIEVLFAALYFYTRIRNKTVHGWDCYLMIPAFAFCFAFCIMIILMIKYGSDGRHLVTVSANELLFWLKLEVAVIFLYFPAVTLPKLSMLCLYLRICTTRGYRLATYGIGGILILIAVVLTIVASLQCQPFAYNWNKTIPGGHCFSLEKFFTWVGLPNIITDLAMILLPLPLVWQLHTSLGQKIGLTLTFFTGSIGIFTAIMRFVQFQNPNTFAELTWTAAEPGAYFIAACLPSLRSLIKPLSDALSRCLTRKGYLTSHLNPLTVRGTGKIVPLSTTNIELKAPKKRHIGPKRLGGPFLRELEDENDSRELVACYRSTESQGSDQFDNSLAATVVAK